MSEYVIWRIRSLVGENPCFLNVCKLLFTVCCME